MDGRTDVLSISWTDSDDGPWKFSIDGRRRTAGRRQTVHLMDGFRRRTIKNFKIWTEVDGWTDGRTFVRGGLTLSKIQQKGFGKPPDDALKTCSWNLQKWSRVERSCLTIRSNIMILNENSACMRNLSAWMHAKLRDGARIGWIRTMFREILKGDPLISPDFFENAMAHPWMKIRVLLSSKLPLVKK